MSHEFTTGITGRDSRRKFTLGDELGRGYSGVVFKLHEGRTTYAGKFPARGLDPLEDAYKRMLLAREAKLHQSVHNQGITPVVLFDRTTSQEEPFLVTPLARNNLARHLVVKGLLPFENAYALSETIAEGLAAVHNEGIIFSDLKPANVLLFVNKKGLIKGKLTDFGGAGSPDNPQNFMFHEDYHAPEFGDVINRRIPAQFTLDQYGLVAGIIRPLFTGDLGKFSSGDIVPSGISAWHEAMYPVATKASAINPQERYSSMEELAIDLRERRMRLTEAQEKHRTILP